MRDSLALLPAPAYSLKLAYVSDEELPLTLPRQLMTEHAFDAIADRVDAADFVLVEEK